MCSGTNPLPQLNWAVGAGAGCSRALQGCFGSLFSPVAASSYSRWKEQLRGTLGGKPNKGSNVRLEATKLRVQRA
jgi:hypothetical protein